MKDFVLELKELNDIEIKIQETTSNIQLADTKQFFLNEFEIAFAKHLATFRKAFAIGKKFAEKVTDESNS